MRRLSTAAMAAPARRGAMTRLRSMFRREPIETLVDMRSVKALQYVMARVDTNVQAKRLEGDAYQAWLKTFCANENLHAGSPLTKSGFEHLVKESAGFIQSMELEVLEEHLKVEPVQEIIDEYDSDEEVEYPKGPNDDVLVEATKLKLSRQKCQQVAGMFAKLDHDRDGTIVLDDIEKVLHAFVQGSQDDWTHALFGIYDEDGDGKISDAESRQILDCVAKAQAAVVAEIVERHVDHLGKKSIKQFLKSVDETNWNDKILEKRRCVFHFARRDPDTPFPLTTITWDSFLTSQHAELPELHRLLTVYAKGFYEERRRLHMRKRENQTYRQAGALLTVGLLVGDIMFAVI